MLIFRFLFKTLAAWVVTRLLGRIFPFLRMLLRVLKP
jgi:hypothetical protein